MEEEKLAWLHHKNGHDKQKKGLQSNWTHLEARPLPLPETIFFVEVRGSPDPVTVGKFENLVMAVAMVRDVPGSWLRPYTPNDEERIEARANWQFQHSAGTKPFSKEVGDGKALFSASGTCGPHKQAYMKVPVCG